MGAVDVNTWTLGRTGLAGLPESVPRARRNVREWLGDEHPAIDDVVLAVSELVTNAVVHSDSSAGVSIHLTLVAAEGVVYVEVRDPGAMFSAPHVRHEPDAETGRGLLIVDEISSEWGIREHDRGRGRTVWCAIRFTPQPVPDVMQSRSNAAHGVPGMASADAIGRSLADGGGVATPMAAALPAHGRPGQAAGLLLSDGRRDLLRSGPDLGFQVRDHLVGLDLESTAIGAEFVGELPGGLSHPYGLSGELSERRVQRRLQLRHLLPHPGERLLQRLIARVRHKAPLGGGVSHRFGCLSR
jgi:anti-sigma regulatory factor (Ser/Thr protein kinase)